MSDEQGSMSSYQKREMERRALEPEPQAQAPSPQEGSAPQCQQCGKPAVFTDPAKGSLLCIDCYYKIQVILYHRSQMLSHLGIRPNSRLAAVAGTVTPEDTARMIPCHNLFSNLKVDDAAICTVNVANLHAIDIELEQIKHSGDALLVSVFAHFVETLVENMRIPSLVKDDLLERLSFVASQFLSPHFQRKSHVAGVVMRSVGETAARLDELRPQWAKLEPLLASLGGEAGSKGPCGAPAPKVES